MPNRLPESSGLDPEIRNPSDECNVVVTTPGKEQTPGNVTETTVILHEVAPGRPEAAARLLFTARLQRQDVCGRLSEWSKVGEVAPHDE